MQLNYSLSGQVLFLPVSFYGFLSVNIVNLFQFAFGELINSYMALFLAGRRVEAKDEQD